MSKDKKSTREVKKAAVVNLNKKVSSYQSEKGSKSASETAIIKKPK